MPPSDYDKELAAWKARQGLPANQPEFSEGELRMFAEERASTSTSWCVFCPAELPVNQMRLITRRIDPYTQMFEGEGDYIPKSQRVRACPECFKEHYES